MIKACIFDLDGVIVDTAHYHFLAWKRLADELGVAFSEIENERLKGVSRMDSLEIILELGKIKLDAKTKDALADKKNVWFVDYINTMKADEIFPGVKDLLKKIRSKGVKVGLASSSKNAGRVIELLKIEKEFDTIVDGTMIVNSKPDPEIFLLAASKLKIAPKECLVFEDAEAGVEAAVIAGMKCIGIGSKDQLGKANVVYAKTAEFKLDLLNSL
ncbi:MAG TPA: beta-phosphoglucomutase [Cyclobacteriaceae bacterium]